MVVSRARPNMFGTEPTVDVLDRFHKNCMALTYDGVLDTAG